MARFLNDKECIKFDNTCVMGSQAYYITHCDSNHFQPMNANFGILKAKEKYKKREKKEKLAQQSLNRIKQIKEEYDE